MFIQLGDIKYMVCRDRECGENTHCMGFTTRKHSWAGGWRQIGPRGSIEGFSLEKIHVAPQKSSLVTSLSLPAEGTEDHKISVLVRDIFSKGGLFGWRDRVEVDSYINDQELKQDIS